MIVNDEKAHTAKYVEHEDASGDIEICDSPRLFQRDLSPQDLFDNETDDTDESDSEWEEYYKSAKCLKLTIKLNPKLCECLKCQEKKNSEHEDEDEDKEKSEIDDGDNVETTDTKIEQILEIIPSTRKGFTQKTFKILS